MSLVIEDGSLPTGANAFVGVAEVRAFAAFRASTIPAEDPAGDAAIEAAIVKATDFIEGLRDRFQGSKATQAQELCFPRYGMRVDGFIVSPDEIPKVLKSAQCQLALDALAGVDLQPSGDGREKIREKIDVLETEWKPGGGSNPQPGLTKARALLAPLLKTGGGLTVSRA